jgi:hypothetical protein
VVLALVGEDHVHFACSRTTNIRSKHNIVRGIAVHLFSINSTREKFDISTTTVDVLAVFYRELYNDILAFIAKFSDRG